MTDRSYDAVTQTGQDEAGDWYLWDCRDRGQFVAHYNPRTKKWTRRKLPNPDAWEDEAHFADAPVLADAPRHSADVATEDESDD